MFDGSRFNALHDTFGSLSSECRSLASQELKKKSRSGEWEIVGIKEGLPKTWDRVEEFPRCEDVVSKGEEEKKGVVGNGSGKINGRGIANVIVLVLVVLGLMV
jgi:hypothetical protein